MSYLKDREIWLSSVPTGNPPAGYFWVFVQNGVLVVRDSNGVDKIMASTAGSITTAATASYVQYSNVANKPTLVSGSSQVSFTGITNKPTLVSGSVQITYSGVSGKPEGIVSSSVQVKGYNVFATTGSNQFNGSQAITGSLTVTGQVVAQTLNVQQVTSSIVYSSGSNIFGNNSGNKHQFTGSLSVTGSMAVNGAGSFASSVTILDSSANDTTLTIGTNGEVPTIKAGGSNTDLKIEAVGSGGFLQLVTNSNPRVHITPAGNVGIGTTSPASQATGATTGILDVSAATGGNLVLHRTGSGDTALFSILKSTNGTYIDSTGAATAANNAIYFRTNNINADQTSLTTALTIASTGAATFSSNIIVQSTGIAVTIDDGGKQGYTITNSAAARTYKIIAGIDGTSNTGFSIRNVTAGRNELLFTDAGAATFSGQLSVGGGSTQSWAGGFNMINIGPGQTSVGAFYNSVAPTQRDFRVFNAMYFDGTNYRYNTTGTVANMFIVGNGGDGGINLFNAPSGTSGNNASLTSIFSVTAAGAATFASSVTAQGFNTSVGTVTAATSTWVTIYTIPQEQANEGVYNVYAHYNDNDGGMAFTQVLADRTHLREANKSNGTAVTIQLSGRNIQVQQIYGTTVDIQWSILWQKLR